MKLIFRGALALSMITAITAYADCGTCDMNCDDMSGMTFFRPRPADQNTALRMMGVEDKMHLFDKECEFYGVFSIAVGYERSTNSCGMGQYFAFGSDGKTVFGEDSNRAQNMFSTNIPADATTNARSIDFLLSPTFSSTVTFNPRITKILVDLDLFLGLDEFINGLWFRASAPIIRAKYDLKPCEENITVGGAYYAGGFIDTTATATLDAVGYTDAISAWRGLGAFGDVEASGCGKLGSCDGDSLTRLGAIHLDLGYDIIRCECGHFGISLHGVIGTGNSPKACNLFPAVAGSYNSQIGVGLEGSWRIWSCDEEQYVTLYGNAVMSHLFSDTQARTLGLTLGGETAGNSYVLLKQFSDAGVNTGVIRRASNMISRNIKVHNTYLFDGSLMLQWRRCWLDLSIGYNFFYISRDKTNACKGTSSAKCDGVCYGALSEYNYGIKGISAQGSGVVDTVDNTMYSKADSNIHASGTLVTLGSTSAVTTNVDTFVKESDITECVALAPAAYSNKLFGYIGYNWECCDYQPYVGVGGSYEWAESNKMANQWGVYLKGGLQF